MTLSRFLRLCACFAIALLDTLVAQDRPNFVLIMADDLGYGDLGCYGHPSIRTPHLDRLAREGIRFTDFHSNGAVCSPTRAALMTGRYQQRAGVQGVITAANHRETGMPLDEITFAEALNAGGYRTGMFGKWHLGYPASFNPVHQGFDEFSGFVSGNIDYHSHVDQAMHLDWWQADEIDDEPGYLTDLVSDKGVDFIKRHKGEPFCLYLAHGAPHYPYQGRKDPAFREPGKKRTKEQVDDFDRRYKEMIEVMDDGVGRILSTLADSNIDTRTLVIFMSDNGASGRAIKGIGSVGNLRGAKGSLWEGGTRVPCIARWPGTIAPNTISSELCLSMDWFPTLVSLGRVEFDASRRLDGSSLEPVLKGKHSLGQRTVFWQTAKSAAVRKGPLKWLTNGKDSQLYNLWIDSGETNDIAAKHPETTSTMRQALEKWRDDVEKGVNVVAK